MRQVLHSAARAAVLLLLLAAACSSPQQPPNSSARRLELRSGSRPQMVGFAPNDPRPFFCVDLNFYENGRPGLIKLPKSREGSIEIVEDKKVSRPFYVSVSRQESDA